MRYTRYEYKKSSKMKFLCSVVIIAGISITGGLYVSKFIFNGNQITNNQNISNSTEGNTVVESENLIALQCGYFSKQENAQAALNKISTDYQAFIVEEDGKYRVLAGIYEEEEGIKKIDELASKGIEVSKIELSIASNSTENKKIIEIIDGFFKITNKLEESEVKSIKTDDYKNWAYGIANDGNSVQSENIDNLINYVKELPDELDKTNITTNLQKIYELVKTYKVS